MIHTREEVIKRAIKEFRLLDRLVSGLSAAQWKMPVPRPETKEPWTVKDALAHITYWKACVTLDARGKPQPPVQSLKVKEGNHIVFKRYHKRSAREVLEYHRRVQEDLLRALKDAPDEWFIRPRRRENWPYDIDVHSAVHRVEDIQGALAKRKTRTR